MNKTNQLSKSPVLNTSISQVCNTQGGTSLEKNISSGYTTVYDDISVEMNKALAFGIPNWPKQNDIQDKKTNFIYKIAGFDDFINHCKTLESKYGIDTGDNGNNFTSNDTNYAINRRYNYQASKLSEGVFLEYGELHGNGNVKKEQNIKHHDIDIWIKSSAGDRIPFDIKGCVFPRAYKGDPDDKNALLLRLIENASKERRKHTKNRIFLIYKDKNGDHKKMKGNIDAIRNGVCTFFKEKTIKKIINNSSISLNKSEESGNIPDNSSVYGVVFVNE